MADTDDFIVTDSGGQEHSIPSSLLTGLKTELHDLLSRAISIGEAAERSRCAAIVRELKPAIRAYAGDGFDETDSILEEAAKEIESGD